MKRLRSSLLLCLLVSGLVAATAFAAPRTMLLETFTNTSCAPCASNNPVVHQFMVMYNPALSLGIQYHVWWPGAGDPFYQLTTAEASGLVSYYGVNGVPANFANGVETAAASLAALEAAAATSLYSTSPFVVNVSQTIAGGQVNTTVTVTAESSVPAGNLRLMVGVIETEKHYATAPGTNGERDFYNSMRRMMPDQNGTTLTIAPDQQLVFNLSTPVNAAWNTALLHSVAWIQDVNTKYVYQAGSSIPQPAYAFYYGAREAADVQALGETRTFQSHVMNAGANSDVYNVHIAKNLPVDWSGSVCAKGICYPPWTTDFSFGMDAGTQDSIQVDITPLVTSGSGTMTITVTSQGDPTKTWTRAFKAISTGLPILCVDADGGSSYNLWYSAALDSTRHPYATWDRAAHGKLSAAQLGNFHIVIWNADLGYPPVTPDDMAALASYLDAGGRLFMSGQDIGWSLCDASSPDCTAEAIAWYHNYLGADYINDDTNLLTLTGVVGDPVGNGLSLVISGGTGSGGQNYPSEINPRSGAFPVLTYAANREAAVRYEPGNFKVVYLAFGFNAISTVTNRTLVMNRILDYFGVQLIGVPGGEATLPHLARAPQAAPNPFNPATKISFAVAGSGPAPVSVNVFDLRGRLVRTLWNGSAAPGERVLTWDGRDNAGAIAGSGVFLARVRVGNDERSLKLVLAK